MSAAVLREAASLMRERAEGVAATPWMFTSGDMETHAGYDVWTYDDETHWNVATADAAPTAEHIAGWHPVVALAVADWLEAAADEPWCCDECKYAPDNQNTAVHALSVARAYLGVSL